MFSPSAIEGGPATATRSRRRQRPKSTDSLAQQPKAKRQRLPLTEQTFKNPDSQPGMIQTSSRADKVAMLAPKQDTAAAHSRADANTEQNTRVKKPKHGDRAAHKGDGSLVLTSTSAYTVSKLPAVPDRIRMDWSANQRAEIYSGQSYALRVTAAHAVIWAYTSTSQSPETFVFTFPSAPKPRDPLPIGSLVPPSASSSEPGLVVIIAGSGRVIFWESISTAAAFAFVNQDRSGVEYLIPGMTSGERVIAITNAESVGFVLTFNTGRLAYMSLRDVHGRPAISVQFLRNNRKSTSVGILGSLRNAFSHLSIRGDVVALRADRSTRLGERNIVALTSKGKLQALKIHRGGHNEFIGEVDVRERLVSALQENDLYSRDLPGESFEALDFTFVPKGLDAKYLQLSRLSDAMAIDSPWVQHLLLLVSLTRASVSRYALMEVIMTPDDCQIGMIRPITSYSAPMTITSFPSETINRPRIYLPRPALVAFVVFERAAVIASVAMPPDSPDSQIQSDNHLLTPSFEDVVDFREDEVHDIIGSGFEEIAPVGGEEKHVSRQKVKSPAVMLMVRGAGVIRIVTADVDKFASEQPPQISAKIKLEQDVFFGARKDSPLIFKKRQDIKFTNEQLGEAALQVSHEILSSTTNYISTLPASMEDNLQARSSALERLILHLDTLGAVLDRKTKWDLLYNAEKMHVAGLLWKRHEAFTAARPAKDKKSLIGLIVEFIHQNQKTNPVASSGELDRVRHWFINDIFRMEIFMGWSYEAIKILYSEKLLDDDQVTMLLSEAMEMNIVAQTGAHDFRRQNLELYGLDGEQLRMGILRDGYEDMIEPWTGCSLVANSIRRLSELCDGWCKKHEEGDDSVVPKRMKMHGSSFMGQMLDGLPALTDAMLISVLEYSRWATVNSNDQHDIEDFVIAYDNGRHDNTIALARAGKWEPAAAIAEKHGCLSALAIILLEHIALLEKSVDQPGLSPSQITSVKNIRQAKKTQLEDNFTKYGEAFAFPVYECLLERHGVEAVLEFDLDTLGYKTQFLRSRPELARISWINDVQQEKDVDHAANTLVELALKKEAQVWSKKIELSMSKLALLAEAESDVQEPNAFLGRRDEARREQQLRLVDNELIVIRIQDQIYGQVAPSTHAAVDSAAALALALDAHRHNIPEKQKALFQVFSHAMEKLLDHQALSPMHLIDVLTLASLRPEARFEIAHPFWMALKVANNSCRSDEVKQAKRLIWRRLFTRDNWAEINDTQLKDDREVVERLAETELFAMLSDCIRYQDPRDPFNPMKPHEALGAFTEHLDRRFHAYSEREKSKLLETMRWEDAQLLNLMERHRLAKWVDATFEAAFAEVENNADEATRVGVSERPSGGGGLFDQAPGMDSEDVLMT
ncbi:hypothetical protein E4U32_006195 [Claviceps aff. humidiphila group G2b]|nr:hypothetical protein E4U32_006195 [Claviceps aff. humidiphila group G2b]